MSISLKQGQDIDELAGILYGMLPGSGNPRLSFPTVARELGLEPYWIGGSKRPAIVALLSATFERARHQFCPLSEGVARSSLSWRAGKVRPLTRDEVESINKVLLRLGYKVPNLHHRDFLASLERCTNQAAGQCPPKDRALLARIKVDLLDISMRAPTHRSFAFEKFQRELFDFYDLAPRGSFRLRGEQIDGSFQSDTQTYLLEAKWQNEQVGRAPLTSLNETVTSKARGSRGLFVSYSGFSMDGLAAFDSRRPTATIAMDGLDLYEALDRQLPLPDVMGAKARFWPQKPTAAMCRCASCSRTRGITSRRAGGT